MKYRRKPEILYAIRFPGVTLTNIDAVLHFEDELAQIGCLGLGEYRGRDFVISTGDGNEIVAKPGYWIVIGASNAVIMAHEAFIEMYDPLSD